MPPAGPHRDFERLSKPMSVSLCNILDDSYWDFVSNAPCGGFELVVYQQRALSGLYFIMLNRATTHSKLDCE